MVLAVCQIATVASPTVLAAVPAASSIAAHEECTCDHSTGVMCPMHRRAQHPNAPRLCSGLDLATYALLPGSHPLAMPLSVAQLSHPPAEAFVPAPAAETPLPLARPPDSPPPRA